MLITELEMIWLNAMKGYELCILIYVISYHIMYGAWRHQAIAWTNIDLSLEVFFCI